MDSQTTHLIGRETLLIEVPDAQEAHEIQKQVASIMQNRVNPRIEKLLSHFSPDASQVLRFDSLSIDIGQIPREKLEQQLEDKVIEALEALLLPYFNEQITGPEAQAQYVKREELLLPLMEFFLQHGYLPWWAHWKDISLQETLQHLVKNEESSLARMLKRIGKSDRVRRRLLAQFNEQEIYAIIRVLEPAEASFIISYSQELQKRHEQKPIVNAGAQAFKKAQLYIILSYLLSDRGTAFNRKEFVAYTLQQLARHYNISYRVLLDFLAENLRGNWQLQQGHSELKQIIESLHEEETEKENDFSYLKISDSIHPADIAVLYESFFYRRQLPAAYRHLAGLHIQKLFAEAFRSAFENKEAPEKLPVVQLKNMLRQAALLLDTGKKPPASASKKKADAESPSNTFDDLDMFRYFLEEQSLFPKYSHVSGNGFLNTLQALIKSKTQALRELLQNLSQPSRQAALLARQLPDPFLIQLLHVIEPTQTDSILLFRKKSLAHQKKNKEIPESTQSFNRILWEFIYQYLLGKKSSRFNNKSFVKQVLRQLAAHYNLNYTLLIGSLRQHIQAGSSLQHDEQELLGILYELGNENPERTEKPEERKKPEPESEGKQLLQALLTYLLHGSLPWWAGNEGLSPAEILSRLLKTSIKLDKALLLPALQSSRKAAILSRLENLFNTVPESGYRLLSELSGTDEHSLRQIIQYISSFRLQFQLPASKLKPEIWLLHYWLHQMAEVQSPSVPLASTWQLADLSITSSLIPVPKNLQAISRLLTNLLKKEIKLVFLDHHVLTTSSATVAALQAYLEKELKLWIRQIKADEIEQELWHIFSEDIRPFILSLANELMESRKQVQMELRELIIKYPEAASIFPQLLKLLDALRSGHSTASQRTDIIHLLAQKELSNSLRYELLSLLFNKREIRQQISRHSSSSFIKQLFNLAAASEPALLQLLSNTADLLKETESNQEEPMLNFWNSALLELLQKKSFNQQYLLQQSIRSFARSTHYQYEELLRLLMKKLSLSAHSYAQSQLLNHLFALLPASEKRKEKNKNSIEPDSSEVDKPARIQPTTATLKKDTASGNTEKKSGEKQAKTIPEKKSKEAEQETKKDKDAEPEPPGSIYVHNAGLVILHPFLARLFDKTGLTVNFAFKSQEHAEKAVHLLEYCASGRDNAPEFHLVLNKLLCGLTPETVIEQGTALSETEKETCDDLLQAVIGQWPALKATSIDGLRGSFLLRKGRLENSESSWNMQVEKKGFDVLLDQVSWSFGSIKLKWMNKALITQWR